MSIATPSPDTTLDTHKAPEFFDPLEDGISALTLINITGSDVSVVNAARVSYGKVSDQLTDRDRKLIHFLMMHDHMSPFEHNQLSFRVKAPLFIARQWMRHRLNSYNEISYRYVKAPLEFYLPPVWRTQDATNRQCSAAPFSNEPLRQEYKKALETAINTYENLLAAGVARELARGILPLCTYTEFIFTCNLRSLMHFLYLRLGHGAQYEIRRYAEGMLNLAKPHFPASFDAWQEKYRISFP